MVDLPTGTVTFLFTDVEGSTTLLRRLGDTRYQQIHADHHNLIRTAISLHGGIQINAQSESFFISFPTARKAVSAAIAIQRAIAEHRWPDGNGVRVRIGLHTGEAVVGDAGYIGMDVHRAARICHAAHGGQILLSQATASLVHDDLPSGSSLLFLGEHSLKDMPRPERIFQLVHPDLPREFPALRSLGATPHNLPIQLTTFVGRAREKNEISSLLERYRMLTLTGPGGGGKTRLAIQVATEFLDHVRDGVWLVELGPLTDPSLVPRAVATDLGLRQDSPDLTSALAEYLRERHALIVLDGCEHILAASARLAETLLRHAPHLRILATSRQPLGVAGETHYVVPPLSLPPRASVHNLGQLEQSDAARLFVERALLSWPRFSPTDTMASAIAQIVERLEGIPLAVELAAARVKLLSVDEIARRLDDRFRFLRGGTGLLARQRTLEEAIDWSYDLLAEEERTLLRRLSVFASRFSLEAVEVVCAGGALASAELIDLLSLLIDKSLVLAEEHLREMRYRLLETIRDYARAKLAASGEAEGLHDAHFRFFLGLARKSEPEVRGPQGQPWLERLETEHDELRAGLGWALSVGRREELLELTSLLWYFWYERGHLGEGRAWLERALDAHTGPPTVLYVRAMDAAGALAWRQGDLERAAILTESSVNFSRLLDDRRTLALSLLNLGLLTRRKNNYAQAAELHQESLELFRNLKDSWGIGESLRLLGIVTWLQGGYARSRRLVEESLEIYRKIGDERGIADALHILGRTTAYSGDIAEGRKSLEEALILYRRMRRPSGLAATLHALARLDFNAGNDKEAKARLEESLALFQHIGDELTRANALALLGRLETGLGELTAATQYFQQSIETRRRLGYAWDEWGIAECIEGLAGLAVAQGNHTVAASLLGKAHAMRLKIRGPIPPIDRDHYERDLTIIQASLAGHAFERAWKQGQGLSTDEALSLVLPRLAKTS